MVLGCVVVTAVWILAGRRSAARADLPGDGSIRGVGAGAIFVQQFLMQVYWLMPQRFEWSSTLPLHVCDLGAWLAGAALLSRARFLRVLTVYWGLALSTQAFITPTVADAPSSMQFWFYWLNHLAVTAPACYFLVASGLRPTAKETWLAVLATFSYVLVVAIVNGQTGWNYAFVGPSIAEKPTVVDHLGPYPLRVVWIMLIGTAAFWVVWTGTRIAGGARGSRDRTGGRP